MSQPPVEPNPYESPQLHASEPPPEVLSPEVARLVRRADLMWDVLVVFASVVYLAILCVIGSDLAKTAVLFSGLSFGTGPAAIHWTAWGAALFGRLFGQFLGGWMFGRFLRRLNPWYVAAGIMLYLGAVAVLPFSPPSLTRAYYASAIGYSGFAAQIVTSVLVAWGAIVGAVWRGQRSQRIADAKRAARDQRPRIESSMYVRFTVGDRETHEVGMLLTASGRRVCTVDGEKTHDERIWALRGRRTLTIGNGERHDITIRWRTFPIWTVEALVDGELYAGDVFPDPPLLLKVLLTVTAALAAALFVTILVFLSVIA